MTSDEWRVQGIEFALSAEGDVTVQFLEKAVKCFTLAHDNTLCARAEAQLQLFLMTDELRTVTKLSAEQEPSSAKVLLSGLKAGLKNEVRLFCELLEGRVKNSEVFHKQILMRL
jgi:hypothetical protein